MLLVLNTVEKCLTVKQTNHFNPSKCRIPVKEI